MTRTTRFEPSRSPRPVSILRALTPVAVASVLGGLTLPAAAQIRSWNTTSGSWNNAGNWTPIGTPQNFEQVFIGNLPVATNSTVTLNVNALVAALSITDGMSLTTGNSQLVVTGTTTISGLNQVGNFVFPSRLRVVNGPQSSDAVLGNVVVSDGGYLNIDGGRLVVNGLLSLSGGLGLLGEGALDLESDAVVAMLVNGGVQVGVDGLTINQNGTGRIDLDGNVAGDHALKVATAMIDGSAWAWLTINGTGLTDAMDDDIWLGRGNVLSMNLTEGWTLGPAARIRVFGGNAEHPNSIITGNTLTLAGTIELPASSSRFDCWAPLVITPSATIAVDANGGRATFTGPVTIEGGILSTANTTFDGRIAFNSPTTYNGAVTMIGSVAQNNVATVFGPTTIDADIFDMDGLFESTVWHIQNGLTVNADGIDAVGNIFDGTMNIVGTALGRLTVNLTTPTDHWSLGPPPAKLNLGGLGGLMTTRIEGSPLHANGVIDVTNAVRIAADTRLQNGCLVVFTTPTSRLRFAGETRVAPTVGFFGEGRLENQVGGTMRLANGANLGVTDLLNAGRLQLGDGPTSTGEASVDRSIFDLTSVFEVKLRGEIPTVQHDRLLANGPEHNLGGIVDVRLLPTGDGLFAPEIGDSFVIMQAPPMTLAGTFADAPPTTVPGKSYVWELDYVTGEVAHVVILRVADIVPCPADLNGDGMVDGADLGILLSAWGACRGCLADLNGDGIVDGADLGILLSAWGACPMA